MPTNKFPDYCAIQFFAKNDWTGGPVDLYSHIL